MDEPSIIFHLTYCDTALTGLALWQGEKVYFHCAREAERFWFRKPGCSGFYTCADDPEWDRQTQEFSSEVVTFINTHLDTEIEAKIGSISISIGPETIKLERQARYDLYRLPPVLLSVMEDNYNLFLDLKFRRRSEMKASMLWWAEYQRQRFPDIFDRTQLEKIATY
jgi:hypothetical protein